MTGPWMVAVVALWVVVIVLAVLLLGLLRRVGPVLERAERMVRMGSALDDLGGLRPGSVVPSFSVVDRDGRTVDFTDAGPADRIVVFVDSDCHACTGLTSTLPGHPGAAELPLVIVTGQETPVEHYRALSTAGFTVLGQPDGAATSAFEQRAFPMAFAVAAGGTVVASTVPGTPTDLEKLAADLRGHRPDEGDSHGIRAQPHTHRI